MLSSFFYFYLIIFKFYKSNDDLSLILTRLVVLALISVLYCFNFKFWLRSACHPRSIGASIHWYYLDGYYSRAWGSFWAFLRRNTHCWGQILSWWSSRIFAVTSCFVCSVVLWLRLAHAISCHEYLLAWYFFILFLILYLW